MKKIIIFILILSIINIIYADSGLLEKNINSKNKTITKPIYCINIPFLGNNGNIIKDNIFIALFALYPNMINIFIALYLNIVYYMIAFLFFLITLSADLEGDTSFFPDERKKDIFIAKAFGISIVFSVLILIFMPYYNYKKNKFEKPYRHPLVYIPRILTSIGTLSIFGYLVYLVLNSSED